MEGREVGLLQWAAVPSAAIATRSSRPTIRTSWSGVIRAGKRPSSAMSVGAETLGGNMA